MLTNEERELMSRRDTMPAKEVAVIDAVFDELYAACRLFDVLAANDDRAAALEAALIKFLCESKS